MSEPFHHCEREQVDPGFCAQDVHGWFGLTYSNYLILPRSLMQEMPATWQHKFVRLLEEMQANFYQENDNYAVQLRDKRGRFTSDPFAPYRYPNTRAIEKARRSSAWQPMRDGIDYDSSEQ